MRKLYAILSTVALLIVAGCGTTPSTDQVAQPTAVTTSTTQTNQTPSMTVTPTTSANPTTPVTSGLKQFTMAEVSAANSATKCLTVINGNVYDLTSWIAQHPGGPDNILKICGIDGSAAFNNQHGGQRRPETTLETFKVGILK